MHSVDEIPASFPSEDDERDWWAAHELSSEVMEAMRLTWEDVAESGPVSPRATDLREIEFPLSIARRHLALIKRMTGKPITTRSDVRLEHATISIVFSAAAVEAGLNLFIAAPVLFIKDEAQRRYFGLLTSKQLDSMSLTDKLDFVCKMLPDEARAEGTDPAPLFSSIRELLDRRNTLVHALPRYSERPDEMSNEQGLKVTCGPGVSDIDAAFAFYSAADEFLDRLVLAPPESVPNPRSLAVS